MPETKVLSVSQLTRSARQILEKNFAQVWVEGELSNFAMPQSGHWYFTLKDSSSQLRCAMFAGRNRAVAFQPRNGLKVVIRGKVTLYEGRGDFQVVVDRLEAAGEGALRQAFDALKSKLDSEGLFAEERKRPLPVYPRHLAIISSGTGAAYQDVLSVIQRRFPGMQISLLPVAVQGPESEQKILKALADITAWLTHQQTPAGAAQNFPPDLLLLTRGGGSLEDLWTFNLESVARALAECPIPSVSAIGHETDFTITDFIADLRAPTPSAAAEIITPDKVTLSNQFTKVQQSLSAQMRHSLVFHKQKLALLSKQLVHPGEKLQQQMQGLDDAQQRLERALSYTLSGMHARLLQSRSQLLTLHPARELNHSREKLRYSYQRLTQEAHNIFQKTHMRFTAASHALNTVSPLGTLARGYAIVSKTAANPSTQRRDSITSVSEVARDELVQIELKDGKITSVIQSIDQQL